MNKGFSAVPGWWPNMGLDGLAKWIDDQAARSKPLAAFEFAEEIEETIGANYTDRELADILRTWSYDYAIVAAEESHDE